jgi:hypothetical protein
MLLILLLSLPPILSEPSPPHRWRFKVEEAITKGERVTTQLFDSGECPPMGCSNSLALKFQPSMSSTFGMRTINFGFVCFTFDQTEPYCKKWAKWAEEYGGCPYWSCKIHWIKFNTKPLSGNTLEVYYDGSNLNLYIPDPWNVRWATGVIAKGYPFGSSSYPSTTFRIWREHERVVPKILDVLKDQAKAIKETENSLQNKTQRDPISWLSLVQEGANLLNKSGLANVTGCFLCYLVQAPTHSCSLT